MAGGTPEELFYGKKQADLRPKSAESKSDDPFDAAHLLTTRFENALKRSTDNSWLQQFAAPVNADNSGRQTSGAAKPESKQPNTAQTAEQPKTPMIAPETASAPVMSAEMLEAARKAKETPEQRLQREYDDAHGKFVKQLDGYWKGVQAARSGAHPKIVTEFEPIYKGPEKPKGSPEPPKPPSTLPTLNEMINNSRDLARIGKTDRAQPSFNLNMVSEAAFKQRYAQEAVNIGSQYGQDKKAVQEICQSIYGFEDGGWGTYDTLSSMPESMVQPDLPNSTAIRDKRRDFHPGSTAVGYNQLLMVNTLTTAHQDADPIAVRLGELAQQDPSRAKELLAKAAMLKALSAGLDKELTAMAKTDPTKYLDGGKPNDTLYTDFVKSKDPSLYGDSLPANDPNKAAMTRRYLAIGVHGLNLDSDIGPIIQARELGHLLQYADKNGFGSLVKDKIKDHEQSSNAYDSLTKAQKTKGTEELLRFEKPPAGASTVKLQEFETTKKALEGKLIGLHPGADPQIDKTHLNNKEQEMLNSVLTRRQLGEPSGELSSEAKTVLNKAWYSHYDGFNSAKLTAAALELANLAGTGKALAMIRTPNADYPTVNWFSRAGYEGNPVTNRRTADELIMSIYRVMSGSKRDSSNPGQADFDAAFAAAKTPSGVISKPPKP